MAPHILVVDGSREDSDRLRHHFSKSPLDAHLTFVTDGEDALDILRLNGPYSPVLRPDLILLDLTLARSGGTNVLKTVKGNPRLRDIPILVMGDSARDQDRHDAYAMQADYFITKPAETCGYLTLVMAVEEFWSHHTRVLRDMI